MTDVQLIRCPACGATNRVPDLALTPGRKAICGRCKAELTAPAGPVTVTDASFATDVEQSPRPVVVDMWAPWCGPCRTIGPIVEALAGTMAGRVRIAKMNVDDNPMTASRFAVRSIPTLLVLKGGQEVDRIVGVQPAAEIEARIERALSA